MKACWRINECDLPGRCSEYAPCLLQAHSSLPPASACLPRSWADPRHTSSVAFSLLCYRIILPWSVKPCHSVLKLETDMMIKNRFAHLMVVYFTWDAPSLPALPSSQCHIVRLFWSFLINTLSEISFCYRVTWAELATFSGWQHCLTPSAFTLLSHFHFAALC